jgi:hypothetical protein
MIWELYRRESPWILFAGVALAAGWAAAVPPDESLPVIAVIIPGMMLLAAGVSRRATLFEAALPIPGRSLFVARLLSFLTVIWAPIVTVGTATSGRGATGDELAGVVAAGMVLTAAGVFSLTARIEEFSSTVPRMAQIVAGAIIIGLLQAWSGHSGVVALFFAAAAGARLFAVWPRIPAAFQAAPIEPRPAPDAARHIAPLPALALLPVLRSAFPWTVIIMLGVIVLQGVIGGWTYGVIAGVGIPGMVRRASRWMWALPVSRPALLAISVLPYVVAMAGGFGLGAWLRPIGGERSYPVPVYENGIVAAECLHFATGASAPVTRAPWGETVDPVVQRFPGFVAYNPYAARPGNSKRFIEWQFERATAAIYGRPITEREYLRPVSMRFPAVVLTIAMVMCLALFGAFCFATLEWRPFGRMSKPWRNAVGATVVVLAFAPVIVLDLATHLKTTALVSAAALHLSAALPDSPWAVLAAAAAIVAAGYAVLTWQFRGLEPSQQPTPVWAR